MAATTSRDRDRRKKYECGDAAARASRSGGGGQYLHIPDGLPQFRPEKGEYFLDICPYIVTPDIKRFVSMNWAKPGQIFWERSFYTHREIGVNKEMHLCPAKTLGEPCPVCEERGVLMQDPKNRNDKKLIEPLMWSHRQILLVHNQKEKDKNRYIELLDISNHAFGKQIDAKINRAREDMKDRYKHFFDPDEGYTLRVIFEETSTGNRGGTFLMGAVEEFIERQKALPVDMVEHGFNLDIIPQPSDYKTFKRVFLMQAADSDEDGGDDRRTTSRDDDRPSRDREDTSRNGERDRGRDEPAPRGRDADPDPGFRVGDMVKFVYRGDDIIGEIDDIDKEKDLVYVKVKGETRPYTKEPRDLELVDEPKAEPEPRGRGRDDRDNDRPTRGRSDRDEPAPRGRGRGDDMPSDPDEPQPRRGRGREDAPADDDPPRRRGR